MTGRATGLHKSIRGLVEAGQTRILLNFSQVTSIDPSGLDELAASRATVSNRGGEIKFLHLTEQMREVIATANLSAVFEIYNNEYDAIASFRHKALTMSKPLPAFV